MRIVDHQDGLVEAIPKRTKVAIVGFASSSRDLAPFDDPEWEIWGLNQLYGYMPRRADRWFEIHTPEMFTADIVPGTDYLGWLAECPIPVYMIEHYPSVPNSVRYPLERMIDFLDGMDYWTSCPAYMAALALAEGFQTIALYGIDLVVGVEYQRQKACLEAILAYGMGKARGEGRPITLEIPKTSALFKARYRYGREIGGTNGPLSESSIAVLIKRYEERRDELLTRLNWIEGARAMMNTNLLNSEPFLSESPQKAQVVATFQKLGEQHEQVLTALNNVDGCIMGLRENVLSPLELWERGVG